MALSGIEIYKLLPRTNCRDCGFPTCLAFAMKVAAHQASPQDCPHITPDALGALVEAATAPVVEVHLGAAPDAVTVGGETELFRHQKTFFHAPAILPLTGDDDPEALGRTVPLVKETVFQRVGERMAFAGVALESRAGTAEAFANAATRLAAALPGPIALIASNPAILEAGARAVASRRPLLVAATEASLTTLLPLAKELSAPLALTAPDLDPLLALSERARAAGGKDLLLFPAVGDAGGYLAAATPLRRLAVTARHRVAGLPLICRAGSGVEGLLAAGAGVARYAGVILWENPTPAEALALFTLRQNIYTDPQRPMKVEEAVIPIGNPGPDSPLLVTTNFSLTYFLVSGEVSNSGVPTHLAVMDADGLSVLTAWAAGKFVADRIVEFLKRSGALAGVSHGKVVIPGYVASLAGEIEELLGPGSVVIGPREATGLPAFLKSWK
jgi:acetyl-CoA decarbonylase/synthase complex subunit gamma